MDGVYDVIVIGHSAGALVALQLAEQSPVVKGVALLEGSLRSTDAAAVSAYVDSAPSDEGRLRLIAAHSTDPTQARYIANVRRCDPELFATLAALVVTGFAEARRHASGLHLPILYVAGRSASADAEAELDLLRGAGLEVTVVAHAGHWPHVDRPDSVAAILNQWADRVLERGGAPP